MDYPESLSWLDALVLHGVKAGLDHTRAVARRLGDPQRRFPSVLIAGTNGKGSTAAFLESSLRAAGLRTGFYTSPHLVDVRERIRVDGALLEQDAFAAALTAVRRAAEAAEAEGEAQGPPTFFEALTLAAFHAFAQTGVQLAVVEVGLGGRLDCTNILEPSLSVVTSIGLDHQEHLGPTLASIAKEKAGIFRPGVIALCGELPREAAEATSEEAERTGAPLLSMEDCATSKGADFWTLRSPEGEVALPPPGLLGAHQYTNAALAVRAALLLRAKGWPISDRDLRHGIASARWPGRLQLVQHAPDTWLDGAHNADGCRALAAFATGLPQPRALVFTCMKDKDPAPMIAALAPSFNAVWFTKLPMARCSAPESLAEKCGLSTCRVEPDPLAALTAARDFVGKPGAVVAAGSLYLVGYLLSNLQEKPASLYGTGL